MLFYSGEIDMKHLIGLMILMLAHVASAAECRVNGGAWLNADTYGFNVYVDVTANTSLGKIVLDGYTMDCRHGMPSSLSPYQHVVTYPGAVRLSPSYSSLEGGLSVSGSAYYPIPVRGGILLSVQRNESYVSVPGRPYLNITTTPGSYINIRSGTLIATITLTIRPFTFWGAEREFSTFVNVYARNSLNLSPSTCTINNNNPLDVDFGSVDPVAVGETPHSSPNLKIVTLNYTCPDPGIYSPINVTFRGTASSFNSSALATSNANLATALLRSNVVVPTGGSFRGTISNSSGRDTVVFSLIRKPDSFPAAGPFTGSATLVMSVP